MNQIKNFSLTAALMAISTTALAHPGHEAIGDVLHVEYLFAAVIVGAVALMAWRKARERNKD